MESNNLSKKIEILEFLYELGATEAYENEPINWLRLSKEEAKLRKVADLEKLPKKVFGYSSVNSQRNTFAEHCG